MSAPAILWLAGALGLGLALLLIGGAVALEFLGWALRTLATLSWTLKKALSRLLIEGTSFLCRWLYRASAVTLQIAGEIAATVVLAVVMPPARRAGVASARFRARMQAKRAALLQTSPEPERPEALPIEPETREKPAKVPDVKPARPKARRVQAAAMQTEEADDEYEEALHLLGLQDRPSFALVDLKLRYAQLKEQLSAESEIPNAMFLEQINAARAKVKKVRGWS